MQWGEPWPAPQGRQGSFIFQIYSHYFVINWARACVAFFPQYASPWCGCGMAFPICRHLLQGQH